MGGFNKALNCTNRKSSKAKTMNDRKLNIIKGNKSQKKRLMNLHI